MDEETKKEFEELKRQLAELKGQSGPKVEVKLPPPRKLSKFNGLDSDVIDWVEDARGAIKGLSGEEQTAFVKRHLEGQARKEINVQSSALVKKAEDIFTILRDSFGDKRTAGKIKKLLFLDLLLFYFWIQI